MNQAVSSSFVAFHVTSAVLLDSGDDPINLFDLPSNDRLVRIPTFCEVYVANTNTAYTISKLLGDSTQGEQKQEHFARDISNYAEQFGGGRFMYITGSDRRLFFAIPMVGFFDKLTVQKRLALASTSGGTYSSGSVSFKLILGATLTLGDGDLYGRLHYDEYALYA